MYFQNYFSNLLYKIGECHKHLQQAFTLYHIYNPRLRLEFVYADTTQPLML